MSKITTLRKQNVFYFAIYYLPAQTGGIMGLMMGFSIISLVEMAYFFIIKPFINGWRKIFSKNTVNIVEINTIDTFELQEYPNVSNLINLK